MRRELILLLAFALPQAPPIDPAIGAEKGEAWHEERIVEVWRKSGMEVETQVRTPSGAVADIVTDDTAWELDWARKHHCGLGQCLLYGAELDKKSGLILLRGEDDDIYIKRARLACERADVMLFLIPLEGPVPFPYRGEAPETQPSDTIIFYSFPNCPPCEKFKRECLPALEAKGWTIEERSNPWVATPIFKYGKETLIGYESRAGFYQWLKNAVDVREE